MRCPTHLSVGQEMVSACINQVFSKSDSAVSSHRAHAHYVGKGGSIKKMISEIYGKETGCSKGLGGSMHLIDLKCNFMGRYCNCGKFNSSRCWSCNGTQI